MFNTRRSHEWLTPLLTPHSPLPNSTLLAAGLENDLYVRQTDGYLPTSEVAFVDEIFKVCGGGHWAHWRGGGCKYQPKLNQNAGVYSRGRGGGGIFVDEIFKVGREGALGGVWEM